MKKGLKLAEGKDAKTEETVKATIKALDKAVESRIAKSKYSRLPIEILLTSGI